jgi:hypothetical protein
MTSQFTSTTSDGPTEYKQEVRRLSGALLQSLVWILHSYESEDANLFVEVADFAHKITR